MKTIRTDIQIRFADVDMLGHVNNVNLQHYFDTGKSAYYREVFGLTGPGGREGMMIVATETSYLAQTRMNDNIYVETALTEMGTKSMTFRQSVVDKDTGEVKATCRSIMVAFDFIAQQTIPVPDAWRELALG